MHSRNAMNRLTSLSHELLATWIAEEAEEYRAKQADHRSTLAERHDELLDLLNLVCAVVSITHISDREFDRWEIKQAKRGRYSSPVRKYVRSITDITLKHQFEDENRLSLVALASSPEVKDAYYESMVRSLDSVEQAVLNHYLYGGCMSTTGRTILIMHALGGKTTLSKTGIGIDSDAAKTEQDEPELKRLRGLGLWDEHNAIWHRLVRKLADTHPGETLLCHSLADAKAADPDARYIFIFPSDDEFKYRVSKSERQGELRRVALAKQNRSLNLDDALSNPSIPVVLWDGRDGHVLWDGRDVPELKKRLGIV